MPPRRRSLDAVLRTVEDILRANRVDHVFVGGVTVLAFGMPRTTTDVDVIAAWTKDTFSWGDYIPDVLPSWLEDKESHVMVCVHEDDVPATIGRHTRRQWDCARGDRAPGPRLRSAQRFR